MLKTLILETLLIFIVFPHILLATQTCPAPPIIVNGTWQNNYTIFTNGTPSQNMITSFRCQNIPLTNVYFIIIYASILVILSASERTLIRFTYGAFIGMFVAFAFGAVGLLSPAIITITIAIWGLSVFLVWFKGSG
ncbi:MAG: hypothetical protein QXS81_01490 [Candidatus Micrarchaeaceae archaeon]